MTWKDRLRPASFRGVPFYVESSDQEFGRRVVSHEFVARDGSWPEDMGLGRNVFQIQGYVVGPDYDRDRDALSAVLAEPGPGTLVHPYRGELQVQPHRVRLRETRVEGAVARFEMTFELAGERASPLSVVDTASTADSTAQSASVDFEEAFEEAFDLDGLPEWAVEASGTSLSNASDSLVALARERIADADKIRNALGDLTQGASSAARALNAPVLFLGGLDQFRGALGPADAEAALRTITAGGTVILGSTPIQARAASNDAAGAAMIRQMILIARVRAATVRSFVSFDEAEALRSELFEALSDEAVIAADMGRDAVYQRLMMIAARITGDLAERAANLARLTDFDLGPSPSLCLAYRLYGDVARESDLLSHAPVWHPAFHPGHGRALIG